MPAMSPSADCCGGLQAGHVVVVVVHQVDAVLGGRAGGMRRAPRRRAVIGAARHQDLALLRGGPRHHRRRASWRRCRSWNSAQSACATMPTSFSASSTSRSDGPVRHVAQRALRVGGVLDLAVAVAQHHRAVGAHEVDIGVAVDVPQGGALGAGEELRIAGRQARHVEWPYMPPGITRWARVRRAASIGKRIGDHVLTLCRTRCGLV